MSGQAGHKGHRAGVEVRAVSCVSSHGASASFDGHCWIYVTGILAWAVFCSEHWMGIRLQVAGLKP